MMSTSEKLAAPPVVEQYRANAKRRFALVLVAILLFLGACVLFLFDPSQASFYPLCVLKKTTGWSCPACGCLRASHQLLHGHIAAALHLNALFIIALPIGGLLLLQNIFQKRVIKKPAYLGWTLLVAFVLFGILRNLPPFLAWSGQ